MSHSYWKKVRPTRQPPRPSRPKGGAQVLAGTCAAGRGPLRVAPDAVRCGVPRLPPPGASCPSSHLRPLELCLPMSLWTRHYSVENTASASPASPTPISPFLPPSLLPSGLLWPSHENATRRRMECSLCSPPTSRVSEFWMPCILTTPSAF